MILLDPERIRELSFPNENVVAVYVTSSMAGFVITELPDPEIFEGGWSSDGSWIPNKDIKTIIPFRVRGFDQRRWEIYPDGFWACTNFNSAERTCHRAFDFIANRYLTGAITVHACYPRARNFS
jgi:hypothetical protein